MTNPQKKSIFLANRYKIEVIVTSLIEVLNFGHMTTSTIYFELGDKYFLGNVVDRNHDIITVILKCLHFKE